jgi:phage terminase large subunit-like protein
LRELIRAKKVDALLSDLSANATMSLQWLFEHWAHDHQLPPEGMWKTWVVMGGRGAGKTRAGAEWIRSQAEGSTAKAKGRARRIALVAETLDQARDIMVLGESGIVACSPPDRRPLWQASRRRLVWPNGAEAQVFSASDPDSLRGPQFDCAWVDELAKWKNGRAAWNMLQFGLRLGDNPRQVVTTTPRSNQLLKDVLSHDTTVTTSAPSSANRAYLAPGFLEHIEAMYGGTRLGREEIDGTLIDDVEGALWRLDAIDRSRVDIKPDLDRIVVAVDPPVTSGSKADACGIVVVGATLKGGPQDWAAYVLEDGSVEGHTPAQWAQHAVRLYHRYGADRIVAEVNQGGDLVETVCRMIDPHISYKAVRASRGKVARAEPAAALYEQGRVHHCVPCTELEDQMCQVTHSGYVGPGSPDRVDALVWALTDLIIERSARQSTPQIRFF